MSSVAVQIENISKKYQIGVMRNDTLRDHIVHGFTSLLHRNRKRNAHDNEIWALRDVSSKVERGEVVGIIGRNGAGKSTLLKILSRITEPTQGRVIIKGRVGSLLEVGTGFHPELTGRENVYLNGAILGMSRKEVSQKFDEIVAFAEIERFLNTPVKRYSSGMYVRLAFAVAAHLEPEILIVDEVLAVGDVAFQKKCLGKMGEVSQSGRTVLFVSHNMTAVQNLCSRAILLRQGQIVFDGPVDETIRQYLSYLAESAQYAFDDNPERSGTGLVGLTGARVLDESNQPSQHLVAGKAASFEFTYQNPAQVSQANVTFTIFNHVGVAVSNFDMTLTNYVVNELGTEGKFVCYLTNVPFPIGQYRVAVAIHVNGQDSDLIPNVLVFEVVSSTFYKSGRTPSIGYCSCMVAHNWHHEASKLLAKSMGNGAGTNKITKVEDNEEGQLWN